MGLLEQLDEEVDLQQGLAAAHGDAAVGTPVAAVALGLIEQLVYGSRGATGVGTQAPGVGVVAVATTHLTTLHENQEPNPWPINGAKGFGRVYIACTTHYRLS